MKPGAENGPKILPEPPAESEGYLYAQALVGPAGSARYSARAVRNVKPPGKWGGTARASTGSPSLRWSGWLRPFGAGVFA